MKNLLSVLTLTVLVSGSAFAGHANIGAPAGPDPFNMSINEDTNSWSINGAPLAMHLVDGVETGILPEKVVAGDVLLIDPAGKPGGVPGGVSDVLRFVDCGNGTANLVQFISADLCPGQVFDTGLPCSFQDRSVRIDENENGFTNWLPGGNTYCILSDNEPCNPCPVTPEPSSLALLGVGGLPLLGVIRRKIASL